MFLACFMLTAAPVSVAFAKEAKDAKEGDAKKGGDKKPADKKSTEKKPKPKPVEGAIGYGGAQVQLQPIMAPYRTSYGTQYQVVTVRMTLDAGLNEKPACFMIPILQEKFLLYFYQTEPTPDDFVGQRKDVMVKKLLDLATATTDRGYYAGVELVDETSKSLDDDPKSKTLSVQCNK